MKKVSLKSIVLLLGFIILLSTPSYVKAAERITWGDVQTGVYDELHPYTLNWTGDVLDRGGLNLSSMKVTSDSKKADFVINQYGSLGANGMVKLNEGLEEDTVFNELMFTNSVTVEQGGVYMILLHDGSWAKIRIDRYIPGTTKVYFSYVLEGEKTPEQPAPGVEKMPPTTVTEQKQTSINLQLNNKWATVDGDRKTLEIAPLSIDGRTMVPLRFIAESLGVQVHWNSPDQRITLISEESTIILWIGKLEASVNGKMVKLDVSPKIINKYTMVPVRFISENLKQNVTFNPSTQTIVITNNSNGSIPVSPSTPAIPTTKTSNFIGKWNLWISGGMTTYYDDYSGEMAESEYTPGAGAGTLEIRSDGTYILNHGIYKKTSGKWRAGKANEVWGYDDVIILENSSGATPWAVRANGSDKIALLGNSGGKYTDGSIIWIIDSEGYK